MEHALDGGERARRSHLREEEEEDDDAKDGKVWPLVLHPASSSTSPAPFPRPPLSSSIPPPIFLESSVYF